MVRKSELQHIGEITDRMPQLEPARPKTENDADGENSASQNVPAKTARDSSTTRRRLSEKWLTAIWRAMTEWYGHRWASQYGTMPLDTWAWGLADLTGDQILHALDRVASKGDAWPPTLPEFRRLAEGADIDRTDAGAVAARMPISRALPVPEDVKKHRREVAAREMKKIRELLRQ